MTAIRSLLLAGLMGLLVSRPAFAQVESDPTTGVITGRVVNGTAGSDVPGSGEPMLHIWDAAFEEQGMEHGQLLPEGSFRFDQVPFVAGWQYAVMLNHQGVTYYSKPAAVAEGQTKLALELKIFEATTATDAVRVTRQHLFFDAAAPAVTDEGAQERVLVGEIYLLSNTGDHTVALPAGANPATAPLAFSLPEAAQGIGLENNQDGRFKPTADGFVDTAPLRPGQGTAEIVVRYTLPYDYPQAYAFRTSWPVDELNILLPEAAGLSLNGTGFQALGTRQMGNGVEVAIFNRENLASGETVSLVLSGRLNSPPAAASGAPPSTANALESKAGRQLAPVILILGAFLIGLAAWLYWRPLSDSEMAEAPLLTPATYERVLAQIARLDEAYAAGQIDEPDYTQRRRLLFTQARQLAPEG